MTSRPAGHEHECVRCGAKEPCTLGRCRQGRYTVCFKCAIGEKTVEDGASLVIHSTLATDEARAEKASERGAALHLTYNRTRGTVRLWIEAEARTGAVRVGVEEFARWVAKALGGTVDIIRGGKRNEGGLGGPAGGEAGGDRPVMSQAEERNARERMGRRWRKEHGISGFDEDKGGGRG